MDLRPASASADVQLAADALLSPGHFLSQVVGQNYSRGEPQYTSYIIYHISYLIYLIYHISYIINHQPSMTGIKIVYYVCLILLSSRSKVHFGVRWFSNSSSSVAHIIP